MVDYSDYVDDTPEDDGMAHLVELVDELTDLQGKFEDAERALNKIKQKKQLLEEKVIPEYLTNNLGLQEVRLKNGKLIKVQRKIYASTGGNKDPARHAMCVAWLEEHNEDGIVKRNIVANFTREENEKAKKLKEQLMQDGFNVKSENSVHSGSLAKWVREKIEAGEEVPHELFGVCEKTEIKIK
ncbi:MAG: hypothetical protein F6K62_16430 [Sphaerospermopsis sp. SIO1G2]|nr:hypothetical protein [Sphaerospermopsis sp. SIO1G2]